MEEHLKLEKMDIERQKHRFEYECKEKIVKDMEHQERMHKKIDRTPKHDYKVL